MLLLQEEIIKKNNAPTTEICKQYNMTQSILDFGNDVTITMKLKKQHSTEDTEENSIGVEENFLLYVCEEYMIETFGFFSMLFVVVCLRKKRIRIFRI